MLFITPSSTPTNLGDVRRIEEDRFRATKNRSSRRGRRAGFKPQRTGETGEVGELVLSHKEQERQEIREGIAMQTTKIVRQVIQASRYYLMVMIGAFSVSASGADIN